MYFFGSVNMYAHEHAQIDVYKNSERFKNINKVNKLALQRKKK